jgi:hypothetical protein
MFGFQPAGIRNFALNRKCVAGVKIPVKTLFIAGLLAFGLRAASAQIVSLPATNPPAASLMPTNNPFNESQVMPFPRLNPSAPLPPLRPGIYLTEPYTCMVKVPGAQPDDCMLNNGPKPSSIPSRNPGLEFVPLKPDGK